MPRLRVLDDDAGPHTQRLVQVLRKRVGKVVQRRRDERQARGVALVRKLAVHDDALDAPELKAAIARLREGDRRDADELALHNAWVL